MKGPLKIHSVHCLILVVLTLAVNCQHPKKENEINSKVEIEVWYGLKQDFGNIGNAQRQINVLGNIKSESKKVKTYYTLNDDTSKNYLTLGSDLHRLAEEGDFNIEIERHLLNEGQNMVDLFVAIDDEITGNKNIVVNYDCNKIWPLPYSVRWGDVKKIQDAVQIVDGHWEITDAGVRTTYKYYDRVLALGDASWRNYEVETTVIFHGYTPPVKGPPTYNVSHVAIATRWPGHDVDRLQPNRKWFPLGATAEFRITDNYDSCRWRIFDGENLYEEQPQSDYRLIQPEVIYKLKHRVEDLPDLSTQYSVKFWKADDTEPSAWDFQAIEKFKKRESGSACLLAHNTDVTFGDISVVSVSSNAKE